MQFIEVELTDYVLDIVDIYASDIGLGKEDALEYILSKGGFQGEVMLSMSDDIITLEAPEDFNINDGGNNFFHKTFSDGVEIIEAEKN